MAKSVKVETLFTTWDCMECKHDNNVKVPTVEEAGKKKFVDARIKCEKCNTEHFVTVSPSKETCRCRIK